MKVKMWGPHSTPLLSLPVMKKFRWVVELCWKQLKTISHKIYYYKNVLPCWEIYSLQLQGKAGWCFLSLSLLPGEASMLHCIFYTYLVSYVTSCCFLTCALLQRSAITSFFSFKLMISALSLSWSRWKNSAGNIDFHLLEPTWWQGFGPHRRPPPLSIMHHTLAPSVEMLSGTRVMCKAGPICFPAGWASFVVVSQNLF